MCCQPVSLSNGIDVILSPPNLQDQCHGMAEASRKLMMHSVSRNVTLEYTLLLLRHLHDKQLTMG